MKKIILVAVFAALAFSGCTVKSSDSLPTKAVKHTVNTPLYVGEVATKVVIGVAITPYVVGKTVADTITKSAK